MKNYLEQYARKWKILFLEFARLLWHIKNPLLQAKSKMCLV